MTVTKAESRNRSFNHHATESMTKRPPRRLPSCGMKKSDRNATARPTSAIGASHVLFSSVKKRSDSSTANAVTITAISGSISISTSTSVAWRAFRVPGRALE
jgi:hypothetical protein